MAMGDVVSAHRLVEFINTRHCPDGDDVLADGRGAAWLADWLGAPGVRIGPEELAPLRELREGLRQLAAANNGEEPAADAVAAAAKIVDAVPLRMRLGDQEQDPGLVAVGPDIVEQSIAAVAHTYLAVRTDGVWSRIKSCAAADCRWAYLDISRNGSRRWCDMANCGNRAKNREWRRRSQL
ncbi:CGNR zinc finger domain-containing protein [Nocardia altamirensis]|uniref:CGNR zinc finger domain-containing protein n=1 Tax=Nocardia altamirensis TaxID=472158 RepID=UPI000A012AC2|nr:CGNR zinc finger domain-containing protein [Nocardia altamirensis]